VISSRCPHPGLLPGLTSRPSWSSAVAALAATPEPDAVAQRLDALIDRQLLARGGDRTFADELPYRFQHLLIRDAAYERLLKLTRAELHEQFADWLTERVADRRAPPGRSRSRRRSR